MVDIYEPTGDQPLRHPQRSGPVPRPGDSTVPGEKDEIGALAVELASKSRKAALERVEKAAWRRPDSSAEEADRIGRQLIEDARRTLEAPTPLDAIVDRLSECIDGKHQSLQVVQSAPTQLMGTSAIMKPEAAPQFDGNRKAAYFSRLGKGWRIKCGGRVRDFGAKKGFSVIHALLSTPDKAIAASALDTLHQPALPRHMTPKEHADAPILQSDRPVQHQQRDPQVAELERLKEKFEREASDAKEINDEDRFEELLQTIETTKASIRSIQGGSRARNSENLERKRLRQRVGDSLRRAMDDVSGGFPELAEHLRAQIKRPASQAPRYESTREYVWVLSGGDQPLGRDIIN